MTRVTKTDHRIKGNQLQVCVALPPEFVERLKEICERETWSMAAGFREALKLLFKKYPSQ